MSELNEVSKPYPTSMRATWPGTDVVIELEQDDYGVFARFPQASHPNDTLVEGHDTDIIRRLGFYVPDDSVPAKECGEMGRFE